MAIIPQQLAILPVSLFSVVRDTLAGHFLEKTAERGQVFEAQNGADFLSAFVGIQQQSHGFLPQCGHESPVKGRQPAGREQIGKCLGRTAKNIGIILHLLLLEVPVHQHIILPDDVKRLFPFSCPEKLARNACAGKAFKAQQGCHG